MFDVGDKVVYPMHGAGTIVAIEEKEVLAEKKKYYILQMPVGNMKVMIPFDKIKEIGLRSVVSPFKAKEVISLLQAQGTKMNKNWNRRYRANLEKIKTGDIFEVGEVVRNLTILDNEKGLSTGEKKMLNNAKQILISELVIAQDSSEEDMTGILEDIFKVDI